MNSQTLLAVAILFSASLTRSTFGFGEALVAMPLLSIVIGVKPAAAIVALTSVVNASSILLTTKWRQIEWDDTWRLLLMSLIGVPVGVYGLVRIPEPAVKLFLAILVISFAIYNLRRTLTWRLKTSTPAFLFGLVSGVLGGAYNTLGPPLVVYGTLRQWSPQGFRGTLQTIFLPTSLAVAAFHYLNRLWEPPIVFRCALLSLPGILLANLLGRELNRRLDPRLFARCVSALLLVIGTTLIANVAHELAFAQSTQTTPASQRSTTLDLGKKIAS